MHVRFIGRADPCAFFALSVPLTGCAEPCFVLYVPGIPFTGCAGSTYCMCTFLGVPTRASYYLYLSLGVPTRDFCTTSVIYLFLGSVDPCLALSVLFIGCADHYDNLFLSVPYCMYACMHPTNVLYYF